MSLLSIGMEEAAFTPGVKCNQMEIDITDDMVLLVSIRHTRTYLVSITFATMQGNLISFGSLKVDRFAGRVVESNHPAFSIDKPLVGLFGAGTDYVQSIGFISQDLECSGVEHLTLESPEPEKT
jgi:hypothetical protein